MLKSVTDFSIPAQFYSQVELLTRHKAGSIVARGMQNEHRNDLWTPSRPEISLAQANGAGVSSSSSTGAQRVVWPTWNSLTQRTYEPPRFLVEHLIPDRQIVVLAGESGTKKTSFMLHVCASLTAGQRVGGFFATNWNRKSILYLNGELSSEALDHYLRRTAAAIPDYKPDAIHFAGQNGIAGFPLFREGKPSLGSLRHGLNAYRPCLVVIDTVRAFACTLEENRADEVRHFFNELAALREEFGCAFVLCHHLRKLGTHNSIRERIAGSGDFVNAADAVIGLTARPKSELEIVKNRTPLDGVVEGMKFKVTARLAEGEGVPASIFEITTGPSKLQTLHDLADACRGKLRLQGGPMTRKELGITDKQSEALIRLGAIVPAEAPARWLESEHSGRHPKFFDLAKSRTTEAA